MSILEKGGNAFDAAAAAGFTLQVVEPHLNGPLGEAPVLVWSEAAQRCEMICGQGVAPAAATIDGPSNPENGLHPIVTTMRALDLARTKESADGGRCRGSNAWAGLRPRPPYAAGLPLHRARRGCDHTMHSPSCARGSDWLFRQCCRIAKALADGHMALAQIHALFIPTNGLDDGQLTQLALVAPLIKTNFNPDEPRDTQGRWSEPGSTGSVMPPLLVPAGAPGRTTPWSIPETPTRAQSK